MIYLLGEMTNGSAKLAETYPRGIGRCYVERPLDPFTSEPWILDNGVFRAWNRNGRDPATDYAAEYAYFESRLDQVADLVEEGRGPLFVVAPDRPGDPASLDVTLAWLADWGELLDSYGIPIYAAVQDGMTPGSVEASGLLERVSGLFLGGTDEFKLTAASWRELTAAHGLGFHWGRCTQSVIADAVELGCDSADSSHPCRLAGARWARFLQVFDTEMAA